MRSGGSVRPCIWTRGATADKRRWPSGAEPRPSPPPPRAAAPVGRVGQPPRRRGRPSSPGGRAVGFLGTAVQHYELGPSRARRRPKRSVADDARVVGGWSSRRPSIARSVRYVLDVLDVPDLLVTIPVGDQPHRPAASTLPSFPGVPRGNSMISALHYDTYTEGRNHFKDVIDAAARGVQPRCAETTTRPPWSTPRPSALLPRRHTVRPGRGSRRERRIGPSSCTRPADRGRQQHASTKRSPTCWRLCAKYAEDWTDHLRTAANHSDNWGLVQLIELSSDDELRRSAVGAANE